MKRIAALMLTLLILAGAVGCAPAPSVKIGILEPLTGADAAAGQTERDAFLAAKELMPEVGGVPIEFVIKDTGASSSSARDAAKELAAAGCVAVLGPWGSDYAAPAAAALADAGIPMLGGGFYNEDVNANETVFRLTPTDEARVTAAVAAIREAGYARPAVICDGEDDYAVFLRACLLRSLGEDGLFGDLLLPAAGTDLSPYFDDLASQRPGWIFVAAPPERAEEILNGLSAAGITCPLLVPDDWESPALAAALPSYENLLLPALFDPAAPELEAFAAEFPTAYSKLTDRKAGELAALSFDAYYALYLALEQAGADGDLLSALSSLSFEGLTGEISFNENRIRNLSAPLFKCLRDGEFVTAALSK